jgi:hypothetical protein
MTANCSCSYMFRTFWGSEKRDSGEVICLFCKKVQLSSQAIHFVKGEIADSTSDNSSNSVVRQEISEEVSQAELGDVIVAINRTTHAVRAFVLFLFYQLMATTVAFALYLLAGVVGNSNKECSNFSREVGNCAPNAFLLSIAFFIWIAGVLYSSSIGWQEIKKSDIR